MQPILKQIPRRRRSWISKCSNKNKKTLCKLWETHLLWTNNYHIQNVQSLCIHLRLAVKFHSERNRIGNDQREYDILEGLRRHHPPDFVLKSLFGDIAPERLSFQCKFYTVSLHQKINPILIQNRYFQFNMSKTWFLSNSQFRYSCSPSFWKVTITKPTKILTMKKAMIIM